MMPAPPYSNSSTGHMLLLLLAKGTETRLGCVRRKFPFVVKIRRFSTKTETLDSFRRAANNTRSFTGANVTRVLDNIKVLISYSLIFLYIYIYISAEE